MTSLYTSILYFCGFCLLWFSVVMYYAYNRGDTVGACQFDKELKIPLFMFAPFGFVATCEIKYKMFTVLSYILCHLVHL